MSARSLAAPIAHATTQNQAGQAAQEDATQTPATIQLSANESADQSTQKSSQDGIAIESDEAAAEHAEPDTRKLFQ